jgi:DnaJ-class molecular chaperone
MLDKQSDGRRRDTGRDTLGAVAMRNFYSVLQVAPKASEAEIKTAFRALAKTCHPDLKPGDRQAEEVFQEAKQAYTFLSHPETRKKYDAFLAQRSAAERLKRRRSALTMSATFILTVASVILAALWLNVGSTPLFGGHLSAGAAERSAVEMARAPGAKPVTEDAVRANPAVAERTGLH